MWWRCLMLKRQGLVGAKPKTWRWGLKLSATVSSIACSQPLQPGWAKQQQHLFIKKSFVSWNPLGAERQLFTVPFCLPPQHMHSFMLNCCHKAHEPAECYPADLCWFLKTVLEFLRSISPLWGSVSWILDHSYFAYCVLKYGIWVITMSSQSFEP